MTRDKRRIVAPIAFFLASWLGGIHCASLLDLSHGLPLETQDAEAGASSETSDAAIAHECAEGKATCTIAERCAVDVLRDPKNCSACGVVCDSHDAGETVCELGKCKVTACRTGALDCDSRAENGCETDPTQSREHCGKCGHSCGGGECRQGVCQAVLIASTNLPVTEINTSLDTAYLRAGYSLVAASLSERKSIELASPPSFFIGSYFAEAGDLFMARSDAQSARPEIWRVQSSSPPGQCVVSLQRASIVTGDPKNLFIAEPTTTASTAFYVAPRGASSCGSIQIASTSISGRVPSMTVANDVVYLASINADARLTGIYRVSGPTYGAAEDLVLKSVAPPTLVRTDATHVYYLGGNAVRRVTKLQRCPDESLCTETVARDADVGFDVDDRYVYIALRSGISARRKNDGVEVLNYPARRASVTAVRVDANGLFWAEGSDVYRVIP